MKIENFIDCVGGLTLIDKNLMRRNIRGGFHDVVSNFAPPDVCEKNCKTISNLYLVFIRRPVEFRIYI